MIRIALACPKPCAPTGDAAPASHDARFEVSSLVTTPGRNRAGAAMPRWTAALVLCGLLGAARLLPAQSPQGDPAFQRGLAALSNRNWEAAAKEFDRLSRSLHTTDRRQSLATFYLAVAHRGLGDYQMAATEFARVASTVSDDSLASEAALQAGTTYVLAWRDPKNDSRYASSAAQQFARLAANARDSSLRSRVQAAQTSLRTYSAAMYFLQRAAQKSAALEFLSVADRDPGSLIAQAALLRTIELYRASAPPNPNESATALCARLRSSYVATSEVARTCPGAS